LQRTSLVSDFESRQLEARNTRRKAMLKKCQSLARGIIELLREELVLRDLKVDAHNALKVYAEAVIKYDGSLSDISLSNLYRLCASLDKKINGKTYIDRREKYWIADQPQAEAAAKAGRKGSKIDGFARPADLMLIQKYADALEWDKQRLEGWIRKQLGKVLTLNELRTMSQVNKVLWPMKRMLKKGAGGDRYDRS
jgi:hypothetical protein